MANNFEAILVVLTGVTGLMFACSLLFKRERALAYLEKLTKRPKKGDFAKKIKITNVIEYLGSFFPVFLIVLIIRSFIVEPFRIPSGSMIPTLEIGDFIAVNKFSYGIKLPINSYTILETNKPKRGDVAVFKYPLDPKTPFIKRIIGLPGDSVLYADKKLLINGEAVAYVNKGPYMGQKSMRKYTGFAEYSEKLSSIDNRILLNPEQFSANVEFEVPEGQYFVLGDNRDNSRDSRFWGFVPEQNLMGKAFFIWMNWDRGINFDRVGKKIN